MKFFCAYFFTFSCKIFFVNNFRSSITIKHGISFPNFFYVIFLFLLLYRSTYIILGNWKKNYVTRIISVWKSYNIIKQIKEEKKHNTRKTKGIENLLGKKLNCSSQNLNWFSIAIEILSNLFFVAFMLVVNIMFFSSCKLFFVSFPLLLFFFVVVVYFSSDVSLFLYVLRNVFVMYFQGFIFLFLWIMENFTLISFLFINLFWYKGKLEQMKN